MRRYLYALPYYGGKASRSLRGLGAWITDLLPPVEKKQIYVEPCAGMLGVLLQRAPAPFEFASDVDDRLVTWWRVLRNQPNDLCMLIEHTPRARSEFAAALKVVRGSKEHADLEVAWAVTVLLWQGMTNGLNPRQTNESQWSRPHKHRSRPSSERLMMVHERIKDVCIDNRAAADVLRWTADKPNTVIYVDPPYRTAVTSPYEHTEIGSETTDLLLAQTGRVAVSGYSSEWDHLGWWRHEIRLKTGAAALTSSRGDSAIRTEVLWTNYPPDSHRGQRELPL